MGCHQSTNIGRKKDGAASPPTMSSSSLASGQGSMRAVPPTGSPSKLKSSASARSRSVPRPPPPAPTCSRHELQLYLGTYVMVPNLDSQDVDSPRAAGAEEESKWTVERRRTITDAPFDAEAESNFKPKVVPKSIVDQNWLKTILPKSTLFAHLEPFEIETIVDVMEKGSYTKGDIIYAEGEQRGEEDRMYVVSAGCASVKRKTQNAASESYTAGEIFGEQELLSLQPRSGIARVESTTLEAWELTRSNYRHLLRGASIRKRKEYTAVLSKIEFLKQLSTKEMLTLADCLQPVTYAPKKHMISYGDEGMWMYIILEGKVEVRGRNAAKQSIHVCYFGAGDHVGELEFINKHQTVADVVAVDSVRAAKVHRDHFEKCMGPIIDLLAKNAERSSKYAYYRSTQSPSSSPRSRSGR
eukprot:NODE_1069_length_1726_cov_33.327370_g945_i0.p1 GENE.NODE_1069_length_1726_cov_33.327370_g945_i0~~NODE_1069_length_1726_cov_33.327370_g945_i0.p1  ORF type:complete len:413 (-),score=71.79 NODE_1069_length_1726_cov_33.327370_g945_i0:351-1589(-)